MDPNYHYSYGYTDPYYSSSSYGHDNYSVYNQPASYETPNPNYSSPFGSYQTYDAYLNSSYLYNGSSSYCTTDYDNQSISTHATAGSELDLQGAMSDVSYVDSLRPTSATCYERQVAEYGNPFLSETTIKVCFKDGPLSHKEIEDYCRGRFGWDYGKITKLDNFHAKIVLKDASLLPTNYKETHYINGKEVLVRKSRN